MQSLLQDLIVGHVFAFLLIFMRLGMALMIMPGVGDAFVSPQVRLSFALAMSFVLTPFLASVLPAMPVQSAAIVMLLLSEGFIGLFMGTIMRIMMGALDIAGMVMSIQAGFSNALVFNPMTATQGSLLGALYSLLGVTLLFITNMHHYMLASVVDSYQVFPATGSFIDIESATEVIKRTVTLSFRIGVGLAIPFLIVGTLVQVGFGLLGRLMPQVQIFFLALPVQILLSLVILTMVLSAGILYWLNGFESALSGAFTPY
jgi:flagellar biosynthesis protein FliR